MKAGKVEEVKVADGVIYKGVLLYAACDCPCKQYVFAIQRA
jgi:hypothetical protein